MSSKANAVDEMTRRVLEIVYPDGIFPTDYPKAIGIVSMIALSTDGILAKPTHPVAPATPRERERSCYPSRTGAQAGGTGRRGACGGARLAPRSLGSRGGSLTNRAAKRQPCRRRRRPGRLSHL